VSWSIIAFIVLTAAASLVINTITILQNTGLMPKHAPAQPERSLSELDAITIELRMFLLILNPMFGLAEEETILARAATREAIEELLWRETVEPYVDASRWRKFFRKGGPLEWFNHPEAGTRRRRPIVEHPGRDEAMRLAGEQWDEMMANIREV
jgi:hypothetical protein